MIGAIISLFGVIRGLFVGGGLVARVLTWFGGGITGLFAGFTSVGTLLFGGFTILGQMWAYVASYHVIEILRRVVLIGFITVVLGFVINYALTNLVIFNGSSISVLFNQFISGIASFGVLGNNLLAILSKVGFFQDLGIFFTVMMYTLVSRIALTILFK